MLVCFPALLRCQSLSAFIGLQLSLKNRWPQAIASSLLGNTRKHIAHRHTHSPMDRVQFLTHGFKILYKNTPKSTAPLRYNIQ